jgi:hypothetical protein
MGRRPVAPRFLQATFKVSLRLLNNDNLVRRVFDQAEMRFQKQDNEKLNL